MPSSMSKLRILVADADRKQREFFRDTARILYPEAEVTESADGIAAFNEAARGRIDLAIVDVNLPRRNGIEMLQIFDGMPDRLVPRRVILVCDDPIQPLGVRNLGRVEFEVALRKEPAGNFRARLREAAPSFVDQWFGHRRRPRRYS
jgi:CheY-like chemotaxis protein